MNRQQSENCDLQEYELSGNIGHAHLWKLERNSQGVIVCNTGSITFPKGGNVPTFATIDEDGSVRMRGLEGDVLSGMALKNGTE